MSANPQTQLAKARALLQAGRDGEAEMLLSRVCRKQPRLAQAWFLLGTLLGKGRRYAEAVDSLQRAADLEPGNALTLFNLGNVLAAQGRFDDAVPAYGRARALAPQRLEVTRALAATEARAGQAREAVEHYDQYLGAHPNDAEARGGMASCLLQLGQLGAAADAFGTALAQRRDPAWLDGLGSVLSAQGKPEDAVAAHREAVKLQPGNDRLRSNLLLSLHYLPDITAARLREEHREPVSHHAAIARPHRPANAARSEGLRVGYVSPDFRQHSVAYFVEALFRYHDRRTTSVYAYHCAPREDGTSRQLRDLADHWRAISGVDDLRAASMIAADRIDILVDLAGHTAGNRLPLFRHRPAPVQVSYLGYPATTGLDAIDYRLVDAITDPPGSEAFHSEALVRLPNGFLCYTPPPAAPSVAPIPEKQDGAPLTFGSFNNLAKINDRVIALWSDLLRAVPGARLLCKNPSLSDAATTTALVARFEALGIAPQRLTLLGLADTTTAHLDTYRQVDVALDTFPYNGTTTTCEALWMGVPVVTMRGEVHAARVSASLLHRLGLDDLVAEQAPDYIRIAAGLAGDRARRHNLRTELRPRMAASPLCDGPAFARSLEAAYQEMWASRSSLRTD